MFVQSVPEGFSFFYFILRVGDNKDHHVCIDKVIIDEIFFPNEEQNYKEHKTRNHVWFCGQPEIFWLAENLVLCHCSSSTQPNQRCSSTEACCFLMHCELPRNQRFFLFLPGAPRKLCKCLSVHLVGTCVGLLAGCRQLCNLSGNDV